GLHLRIEGRAPFHNVPRGDDRSGRRCRRITAALSHAGHANVVPVLAGTPRKGYPAETALLFLQLIMRKLKRQPTPVGRPARAAVVVPNGTAPSASQARSSTA